MIKKMATLRVTPEFLRDLLQLPESAELVRCEMEPGTRGTLHLMIEGAGWDTSEGAQVLATKAEITEEWVDNVRTKTLIDWGFPP